MRETQAICEKAEGVAKSKIQTLSLTISPPPVVTEIIVEKGVLRRGGWIPMLREVSGRFVLITDEKVCSLWANPLSVRMKQAGFEMHLLSVPSGERSKSREWKEVLEERMIEARCGRDTAVIALGGGVITDLAGFVAATYCRGLPFVSIPTTLLGMVDASLGGKVGINTLRGKNMIGAFHHPRYIFIDTETLVSLPSSEILNGLSEMIKYALIASRDLFDQLVAKKPLDALDAHCIRTCCEIKMGIVTQDPHEVGIRRILNFGHTVGHAIETASDYRIAHGAAIAIGMITEAYLSCQLGYLSEQDVEEIRKLFDSYGFPLELHPSVAEDECMEIMRRDKKANASQPRCVLLHSIGKPVCFEGAYCGEVPQKDWEEALRWMFATFSRQ